MPPVHITTNPLIPIQSHAQITPAKTVQWSQPSTNTSSRHPGDVSDVKYERDLQEKNKIKTKTINDSNQGLQFQNQTNNTVKSAGVV